MFIVRHNPDISLFALSGTPKNGGIVTNSNTGESFDTLLTMLLGKNGIAAESTESINYSIQQIFTQWNIPISVISPIQSNQPAKETSPFTVLQEFEGYLTIKNAQGMNVTLPVMLRLMKQPINTTQPLDNTLTQPMEQLVLGIFVKPEPDGHQVHDTDTVRLSWFIPLQVHLMERKEIDTAIDNGSETASVQFGIDTGVYVQDFGSEFQGIRSISLKDVEIKAVGDTTNNIKKNNISNTILYMNKQDKVANQNISPAETQKLSFLQNIFPAPLNASGEGFNTTWNTLKTFEMPFQNWAGDSYPQIDGSLYLCERGTLHAQVNEDGIPELHLKTVDSHHMMKFSVAQNDDPVGNSSIARIIELLSLKGEQVDVLVYGASIVPEESEQGLFVNTAAIHGSDSVSNISNMFGESQNKNNLQNTYIPFLIHTREALIRNSVTTLTERNDKQILSTTNSGSKTDQISFGLIDSVFSSEHDVNKPGLAEKNGNRLITANYSNSASVNKQQEIKETIQNLISVEDDANTQPGTRSTSDKMIDEMMNGRKYITVLPDNEGGHELSRLVQKGRDYSANSLNLPLHTIYGRGMNVNSEPQSNGEVQLTSGDAPERNTLQGVTEKNTPENYIYSEIERGGNDSEMNPFIKHNAAGSDNSLKKTIIETNIDTLENAPLETDVKMMELGRNRVSPQADLRTIYGSKDNENEVNQGETILTQADVKDAFIDKNQPSQKEIPNMTDYPVNDAEEYHLHSTSQNEAARFMKHESEVGLSDKPFGEGITRDYETAFSRGENFHRDGNSQTAVEDDSSIPQAIETDEAGIRMNTTVKTKTTPSPRLSTVSVGSDSPSQQNSYSPNSGQNRGPLNPDTSFNTEVANLSGASNTGNRFELSNGVEEGNQTINLEISQGSGATLQAEHTGKTIFSSGQGHTGSTRAFWEIDDRHIMNTIVHYARFLIQKGQSSAVISLEPPSLGKLKLDIVTENSKVTCKITVETQEVKDLIQNSLASLKESLAQSGLKVESFDVNVGHNNGTGSWADVENFKTIVRSSSSQRSHDESVSGTAGSDDMPEHGVIASKSLYSEILDVWI